MDYIGTNSQGTANAPNGMSDQLLETWFQPGFPFLGAGHCAILPWPHVRNQEKRFPREHFTLLVSKSEMLVSVSLLLVRKSDLLVSVSLLLVRKSDLLASISLLLVRKSDLLVSVSLLLASKSDFLVADGLPSFSDDPSTRYRACASRRPLPEERESFQFVHLTTA